MKENIFFQENPSKNADIKSLSFSSHKKLGITLDEFINTLDNYPCLNEIDLSFGGMTDNDVYKLVEKLQKKNPLKIKYLDLGSNSITDLGVKALATLPLTSLYLSGNHSLTNQSVEFLLPSHTLVSLDLAANELIDRKNKNQIKEMLHRNIEQKKIDFLKEIIQLASVAKKKPDWFGPSMTLPLANIFKYLAADIKFFVTQNPQCSEHQIVSVAEYIYNLSLQGKLEEYHMNKAKLFLNNQIKFEEVFKKDSHSTQCILM